MSEYNARSLRQWSVSLALRLDSRPKATDPRANGTTEYWNLFGAAHLICMSHTNLLISISPSRCRFGRRRRPSHRMLFNSIHTKTHTHRDRLNRVIIQFCYTRTRECDVIQLNRHANGNRRHLNMLTSTTHDVDDTTILNWLRQSNAEITMMNANRMTQTE